VSADVWLRVSLTEIVVTDKRHLKIHLFKLNSCAASIASVSSDLKALYKSVIIIIIIINVKKTSVEV